MLDVINKPGVQAINYNPSNGVDTTDLEAATKTITAVAEAVGVGNADYSSLSQALNAPTDARLVVNRIVSRLQTTIDSMTATTAYCRVYVDAQDTNHLILDLSWTTTGAKLSAIDAHSGALPTVFGTIGDGASHNYYFFFWVNAGNAVLSLVELQVAVGSCATSGIPTVITLNFKGLLSIGMRIHVIGTGTPIGWLFPAGQTGDAYNSWVASVNVDYGVLGQVGLMAWNNDLGSIRGNVATDINLLYAFTATLYVE